MSSNFNNNFKKIEVEMINGVKWVKKRICFKAIIESLSKGFLLKINIIREAKNKYFYKYEINFNTGQIFE